VWIVGVYGKAFSELEEAFGRPYFVSVNGSQPNQPLFMKAHLDFSETPQSAVLLVRDESVKGKPHTIIYAGKVVTYRSEADEKGRKLPPGEREIFADGVVSQLLKDGRAVSPDRLSEALYCIEQGMPLPEKKSSSTHLPAITPELMEAMKGKDKGTNRESVTKSLKKHRKEEPLRS
jgi:hypothetical protein